MDSAQRNDADAARGVVLHFRFGGQPPRRTHQNGVKYRRDDRVEGGVQDRQPSRRRSHPPYRAPRRRQNATFGGYGYLDGKKMPLADLKAAIRERRLRARQEARAAQNKPAGTDGQGVLGL